MKPDYDPIHRSLSRNVHLSASELDILDQLLIYKTVPKKTFLLQEGDVCRFEAYILKGCIKSYFLDENGFEVVLTFATEDWWVSDMASFYSGKPSNMYIETLEDCELFMLHPENKELLLTRAPKFERVFRLLIQRHLSSYQERLYKNIAVPAQERYLSFVEKYPGLVNRIPQRQIAAYLGISPEFLSKVRGRLSKKPKTGKS